MDIFIYMNLQEHIRKVLKEERTESIVKIIGDYIKTFYPRFNKDDVDTHEMIDGRGFIVTIFLVQEKMGCGLVNTVRVKKNYN